MSPTIRRHTVCFIRIIVKDDSYADLKGDTMPRRSYRQSSAIFFVLLLTLLTGCAATIPDLKPFADGTAELRTSTSASFSATANSLNHMAFIVPDDLKDDYEKLAKQLSEPKAVRIEALDAFVAYSDRLAEIAASSQSQKEQVEAAANALSNLTSTFASFSPFPGSKEVVEILSGAGKKAAQYVTQVRSVEKLEDAVKQADPAVNLLTEALLKDLDKLKQLFVTAEPALRAAFKSRDKVLLDYYDQLLQVRKTLAAERREQLSGGTLKDTEATKTLKSLDEQIASAKLWRDPLANELDTSVQTLSTNEQLIQSIRGALNRWQRTHSDLAKALAESRRPSIRAFSEAIEEIKNLVEKLRKLDEEMRTES